ncbi:MAG: DUF58 domain-containing protein [Spirochaetes bacterium]|nr:DUF58 domain-containing protein [Spirochaetota bacterium]
MNDKILFKKLFFKIKFFSNKFLVGNYKSRFKGEGVDFVENRDYFFGDSIRNINWNLWAKFGKPYTKIFDEERGELNLVVLDFSSSMFFNSQNESKFDIALKISLTILYISLISNDKFSFLIFSDKLIKFFPFGKGEKHFYLIYNYLLGLDYVNSNNSILVDILRYLYKILKKRTNIFIISDFIVENQIQMIENLKIIDKKHNIFLFQIFDLFEIKIKKIIRNCKLIEGFNTISNVDYEEYFYNLQKNLSQNFKYYFHVSNEENVFFVLKNYFERKIK